MTCGKTAVFAAITTKSQLYRNYEHVDALTKTSMIDSVIMMMRWDGTIGFIGGGVDEGETEREALFREVKEEIGYDLKDDTILTPLTVDFTSNNTCVKMFHIVVSEDTYKEILGSQHKATHGLAEGSAFSVQLTDESIKNILSQNFAETVHSELLQLLKVLKWNSNPQ